MGRLKQRAMWVTRQDRPSHRGFAGLLGISFLLLFSGCAQLDQLLGKQADADKPALPVQATEPVSKPAAKKKADESRPSSVATEPRQQAPAHAPAAGVAKPSEPDKAFTEKEQSLKEKKSRVASDRKSKKSPKPQAEIQPPTEDDFLPPIPLPSKPAAIGGSGG